MLWTPALEKKSPQKVRSLFFSQHFSPMSWTLFFSKPKCLDFLRTNFLFFAGATFFSVDDVQTITGYYSSDDSNTILLYFFELVKV